MLSDGYSITNAWATYRVENSLWFSPQQIPVTMLTKYGQAAEPQRDDGTVRSRMAFRRPPCQGVTAPGGPTRKQRAIRRSFKSVVDNWRTLSYTDRTSIFDSATAAGFWYYTFYIQETINMFKNIQYAHTDTPSLTCFTINIPQAVNPAKCDIRTAGYNYHYDGTMWLYNPLFVKVLSATQCVLEYQMLPAYHATLTASIQILEYY